MGIFSNDKMKKEGEEAFAAAAAAAPGGVNSGGATEGPDYEPIAGVSLELFAEISKGLAAYNYDQSKAPEIAASKGVSGENWQTAMDGWGERMKSNPQLAAKFNKIYTGRA